MPSRPSMLFPSHYSGRISHPRTSLSLSLPGFQYYRTTIAAGLELFQKGGLLLPLTWRHGIYGTWMQCPASLGQTTRYQICISGCRSSSIRYQRLHSPSPIMGSPSLAQPSTSLKHRLNFYIKGPCYMACMSKYFLLQRDCLIVNSHGATFTQHDLSIRHHV